MSAIKKTSLFNVTTFGLASTSETGGKTPQGLVTPPQVVNIVVEWLGANGMRNDTALACVHGSPLETALFISNELVPEEVRNDIVEAVSSTMKLAGADTETISGVIGAWETSQTSQAQALQAPRRGRSAAQDTSEDTKEGEEGDGGSEDAAPALGDRATLSAAAGFDMLLSGKPPEKIQDDRKSNCCVFEL